MNLWAQGFLELSFPGMKSEYCCSFLYITNTYFYFRYGAIVKNEVCPAGTAAAPGPPEVPKTADGSELSMIGSKAVNHSGRAIVCLRPQTRYYGRSMIYIEIAALELKWKAIES